MSKRSGIRWCRWRVGACLGIVLLGLILPERVIESVFSRGLFPLLQAVLVPVFGFVSVPLMGMVVLLVPPFLVVFVILRWRRGRALGTAPRQLWRAGALSGLRSALYVYVAFLLVWGLGYRREAIETRWRLGASLPTVAEVRDVQARLIALIRRDCVADDQRNYARALKSICASQARLVTEMEGFTPSYPSHVKHPPEGWLLAVGIYGIVSPFTLEANVDVALPPSIRLGICAHELAHLAGYCGEADANLVGFVAGLRAEDPFARYGTALSMLRFALSIHALDDANWAYRRLPERARRDLRRLHAADAKHQVQSLSRLTTAVNDRYLQTQGVELGVGDYARGYTLFVKAFHRGLVDLPPPLPRDELVPAKKTTSNPTMQGSHEQSPGK